MDEIASIDFEKWPVVPSSFAKNLVVSMDFDTYFVEKWNEKKTCIYLLEILDPPAMWRGNQF